MTFLAVACAACAVMLLTGPPHGVTRVRAALGRRGPDSARSDRRSRAPRADSWSTSSRGRLLTGICAAGAGWAFVGGVAGVLVAVIAGVAAWLVLGRLEPRSRARERARLASAVPLAADLLVAALAAGCPPLVAVDTVGTAIGGPLGRALLDAGAASSVGADPHRAWAPLTAEPATRPLARALVSAMSRGTSPGPALRRAAADTRDAARWAGEAQARSLGARAAAPLGLCFLPAFVLVGVVPIVATSGVLIP